MQIDWKITKKRGNHRPTLNYTITLEAFEKKLAIHAVNVQSRIPEIPNSHESFCLPGENERHCEWCPKGFHRIQVPYFKKGVSHEFIRLPFRESGEYPEVEASFKALREHYETQVRHAYGHSPFETQGSLGITRVTRKQVAAKVTAERLLGLFSPNGQNGRSQENDCTGGGFFIDKAAG